MFDGANLVLDEEVEPVVYDHGNKKDNYLGDWDSVIPPFPVGGTVSFVLDKEYGSWIERKDDSGNTEKIFKYSASVEIPNRCIAKNPNTGEFETIQYIQTYQSEVDPHGRAYQKPITPKIHIQYGVITLQEQHIRLYKFLCIHANNGSNKNKIANDRNLFWQDDTVFKIREEKSKKLLINQAATYITTTSISALIAFGKKFYSDRMDFETASAIDVRVELTRIAETDPVTFIRNASGKEVQTTNLVKRLQDEGKIRIAPNEGWMRADTEDVFLLLEWGKEPFTALMEYALTDAGGKVINEIAKSGSEAKETKIPLQQKGKK